jgi:hypothetical protein
LVFHASYRRRLNASESDQLGTIKDLHSDLPPCLILRSESCLLARVRFWSIFWDMKTGFLAVLAALALVTTGFSGGWHGHGGWHGGYRGGYHGGYGHRYYHSGYYRWHGGWRYFAGGYNPWWLLPIPVPYPYYGGYGPGYGYGYGPGYGYGY